MQNTVITMNVFRWLLGLFNSDARVPCCFFYLLPKLHRLYGTCVYKWWVWETIFTTVAQLQLEKAWTKLWKSDAKPLFSGKHVHTNKAFYVFQRRLVLLHKNHLLHKKRSNSPKKPSNLWWSCCANPDMQKSSNNEVPFKGLVLQLEIQWIQRYCRQVTFGLVGSTCISRNMCYLAPS